MNFLEYTDEFLAQHAVKDPQAFADLYRRYVVRVYRFIFGRLGDTQDAEDVTAQTFLAAWENLPRYRDQGSFAAWLFAIARRKVSDHLRRRRKLIPLDWVENLLQSVDDPLYALLEAEELRLAQAIVQGLTERERELLCLRYAAGLSFEEMAQILKRKPSAVKMALYRLLERLRDEWNPNLK